MIQLPNWKLKKSYHDCWQLLFASLFLVSIAGIYYLSTNVISNVLYNWYGHMSGSDYHYQWFWNNIFAANTGGVFSMLTIYVLIVSFIILIYSLVGFVVVTVRYRKKPTLYDVFTTRDKKHIKYSLIVLFIVSIIAYLIYASVNIYLWSQNQIHEHINATYHPVALIVQCFANFGIGIPLVITIGSLIYWIIQENLYSDPKNNSKKKQRIEKYKQKILSKEAKLR